MLWPMIAADRSPSSLTPGMSMAIPLSQAVARPKRLFGKLKNWRRIATRYDRLAQNYMAALAIVATIIS